MSICPLTNERCLQDKCAWWVDIRDDDVYADCAIPALVLYLSYLTPSAGTL